MLMKKKLSVKLGAPLGNLSADPEVKLMDLNSIHLWKENPRKNDKSVKPLSKLLERHGQKSPLVVWRKNMTIYKGNTTFKAAKLLKWDKIWVALVDFKSDEDAVAYALADNKSSEWSDWDESVLAMLIPRSFKGMNREELATITGFKEVDLAGYLIPEVSDLPDALPESTLQGIGLDGKADYLVLQFESHAQMEEFRKHFDVEKHPRVIPYQDLMNAMTWKDKPTSIIMKKKIMKG